jgi:bifunctional enzyme CysN/CysC
MFIPVSAITRGKPVRSRSEDMPMVPGADPLLKRWTYSKKPRPKGTGPCGFRFRPFISSPTEGDDRRIVAGRVESGRVKVGDRLFFSPSNKSSVIKSIEAFNAPSRERDGGRMVHGVHPYRRNLHHPRGTDEPHGSGLPWVSTRFRANMIWLGKKPFEKNKDYKLKIHTQAVPVRLDGNQKSGGRHLGCR